MRKLHSEVIQTRLYRWVRHVEPKQGSSDSSVGESESATTTPLLYVGGLVKASFEGTEMTVRRRRIYISLVW